MQMQNQSQIVRPDEVKTCDDYARRKPDRYFYIIFEENVWECDGYKIERDGAEPLWTILLICPMCRQNLKLDSTKKKILIDEQGLHLAEPIACAWPGEFGTACNFQVAIEPPRKAEDKMVRVNGMDGRPRQVKIDAVARRV
jgi:hypothetical protein